MRSEFTVAGTPTYDRRSPARWILSHQLRNPWIVAGFLIGSVTMVVANSMIPGLTGRAFDAVLGGGAERDRVLVGISLTLLAIVIIRSGLDMLARLCAEVMAKRMERDARDELYLSLLGKSQTFHNRQRVGDLMARGANDVRQLSTMISPGIDLIVDSLSQGIVPLIFIAFLDWRLLAAPLLFAVAFVVSIRRYMHQLEPVSAQMRERFGTMNAGLNETVRGIEVVKATAQEGTERARFTTNAVSYRDAFVRQGIIQARYLPTLLLAVAMAGALLHGLTLQSAGEITVGQLVAYLGLMGLLGFPAFISIFSFSLVQMGLASAERLLSLMRGGDGAGPELRWPYRPDAGRDRLRARLVRLRRRRTGPAGPLVSDRAGRDRRDRRRDRLRQEHADQAGQPHLRRRRRAASWSTASTCATGTWTRCARRSRRSSRTSSSSRAPIAENIAFGLGQQTRPGGGRAGGPGRAGARLHLRAR